MAADNPLPGNRFNLYRRATGSDVFVCQAVNLTLTQANEFEDATMPDCDNPTAIPTRKSTKRMTAWNVSFGGKGVAAHIQMLQDDYASESAVEYKIKAEPAGGGGGAWVGDLHFENLEHGKSENGMVTVSVQARGDGELVYTAA